MFTKITSFCNCALARQCRISVLTPSEINGRTTIAICLTPPHAISICRGKRRNLLQKGEFVAFLYYEDYIKPTN
ncbi:hypothetical protein Y032_0117g700 [Ancylostoma ceylanicum]|uniref:Uncharacterized protein n=1 Tax=Ancylostoma ceylanicum TaxID=53326 RepID=A0A016TC74_9BILA|nr:hypothetical protein Y032_0117g700 [Ancylostoma ceylanicum]